MNFIDRISNKAFKDEYLKELLYKLEEEYSNQFFNVRESKLTETEINHLLRFSDILCRSKDENHRNLSLKIISLLVEVKNIEKSNYLKVVVVNTLIKLGNFPSLSTFDEVEKYFRIIELRKDYITKSTEQVSPLGDPFTDSQYRVFEEMKNKSNYSFSGSTSFGKSFIFESFIKYIIESKAKNNIVFMVPTKALINQVSVKLKQIAKEFNYKVVITPNILKINVNFDSKYIFVFTPERFVTYVENEENDIIIKYLFVDEAHKLLNTKDTRTPLFYHAISLAKKNNINIYFASPNIPDPSVFLKLLNLNEKNSYFTKESPVVQNKFFIDTKSDKSFMISDFGLDINLPKFNFKGSIVENLKKILDIFSNGDSQSIIYCNTVSKTTRMAIDFANISEEVKCTEIEELINLIDKKIHNKYYLKECLKKGIAYHFSGIPEEIKLHIENLYKKGVIKILFCTSTLLEGVNLPAKNIFILSEKIGIKKMNNIDFWNLAGRAGRLSKEISGNIFCVNIYNEKGYWKNPNLDILRYKKINQEEPQIIANKNKNLYTNINNYFLNKEYTNKKMDYSEKRIIEMYGNIIILHELLNEKSVLKDKFNEVKGNRETLSKIKDQIKIDSKILSNNIGIGISYQNRIMDNEKNILPDKTEYEGCLLLLKILCKEYNWEEKEKDLSSKRLKYYAILLEAWINTKPLNYIIKKSINYYYNNGKPRNIKVRKAAVLKPEKFDINSIYHINEIINNVVKDIENILKFKIKNYVSNYQSILKSKNIGNEDVDWEKYIEYGTTNKELIDIQELGFPRHLAIFIRDEYSDTLLKYNETIYGIEEQKLRNIIDKNRFKFEFEELKLLLDWEDEE